MSAALVQDGEIVWERGFGFQNQESRVRATPDTPYPIADISQTIAAVLVLQCAEQRRLEHRRPCPALRRRRPRAIGDAATGAESYVCRCAGRELSLRSGALLAAHAGRRDVHPAAVSQERRGERARTAGDEGLGTGTRSRRSQRVDRAPVRDRGPRTLPQRARADRHSVQGRQTRARHQERSLGTRGSTPRPVS